MLLKPI